jgi:cytochrome c
MTVFLAAILQGGGEVSGGVMVRECAGGFMGLKSCFAALLVVGAVTFSTTGHAADRATAAEAETMVRKSVDFAKANGTEKALAEISNPTGPFRDRDLYVTVYDMSGKCIAHGANAKLIGKDLIDTEDSDGKPFVKERMQLAKAGKPFWHDYKFSDPLTKKIEPKATYCIPVDGTVYCGGIYKP